MEIAPLGSGRHAHQVIAVVTKGPHTEGRWALTTALYRTPEGGVCVWHPWDQPFLPAGADPHGMWPYLYEKIVDGNGGNGYSFEVEGCEVDDVAGITALIQARADEVANNTYGPFGNEVHFWNSSPAATEPEPDDTLLVAEEPQPPIEALSWRLAARLATDLGTTYELQERHDGNGTYDQLYFASESRLRVSPNRVGSVFVMTPELDRIFPHAEWGSLAQAADMEAVAQRTIRRVGGSGEPMKGADVIAVIAGAMDLPRAHEAGWTCRWPIGWDDGLQDDVVGPYAEYELWLEGRGWRTHWFIYGPHYEPVAAFDLDGYVYVHGRPAVELPVSYPGVPAAETARRLFALET